MQIYKEFQISKRVGNVFEEKGLFMEQNTFIFQTKILAHFDNFENSFQLIENQ